MENLGDLFVGALVYGAIDRAIGEIDVGEYYQKTKDLAKRAKLDRFIGQYYNNRLHHNAEKCMLLAHNKLEKYITDGHEVVPPDEGILIPVCNSAAVYGSNQHLQDMFAELLAKASLKDKQCLILNRYVKIIEQLSSDEAMMLEYMKQHDIKRFPTIDVSAVETSGGKYIKLCSRVTDCFDSLDLGNQENLLIYFDNLISLGIMECVEDKKIGDDSVYDRLKNLSEVQRVIEMIVQRKDGYSTEKIDEQYIKLTKLGVAFADICIAGEWGSGNVYKFQSTGDKTLSCF